jgi:hypothetical protein
VLPTTTTLAVTPTVAVAGQTVTLTATVGGTRPDERAGESVTFRNGAAIVGTALLDTAGRAVLSTAKLTAGSYQITAVYPGDANYTGGTSNVVPITLAAPLGVEAVQIDTGGSQRSVVRSVTVVFTGPATLASGAFELTQTGVNGIAVGLNVVTQLVAGRTVATLTFRDSADSGSSSLADGNYRLTIRAAGVTDSSGQPLDGDGNGLIGGDNVSAFFRLFGDVSGDRAVDGVDLTAFRNAFGTVSTDAGYVAFLDFNGDGAIDGTDLTQFRNRFGVILP